jgi:hypothetical protein
VTHAYTAPGQYTVVLDLDDLLGGDGEAARTLTVLDNAGAPTARFTIRPTPIRTNREVIFDGSASSDPNGQIVRYQWHIDLRRVVQTSEAPVFGTLFTSPGQGRATLTVYDSEGFADTETQTFDVLPPAQAATSRQAAADGDAAEPLTCAAPAASRAARGRGVRETSGFSARVRGRPLQVRRGAVRRHRGKLSLGGVGAAGRLRVGLLAGQGRGSRAERLLRRFLNARLVTRAKLALERRKGSLAARATALARLPRASRHAVCLRTHVRVRPGSRPRGRLKVLGGRGAGSRLRGTASFQFRLERDGTATVLGRLRARRGPGRPLPPACRRLAGRA